MTKKKLLSFLSDVSYTISAICFFVAIIIDSFCINHNNIHDLYWTNVVTCFVAISYICVVFGFICMILKES